MYVYITTYICTFMLLWHTATQKRNLLSLCVVKRENQSCMIMSQPTQISLSLTSLNHLIAQLYISPGRAIQYTFRHIMLPGNRVEVWFGRKIKKNWCSNEKQPLCGQNTGCLENIHAQFFYIILCRLQ